jgi:apolipoprotein N-acyltransferase
MEIIMLKRFSPVILFLLGFVTLMFTRRSEIVPTINIAILIAPVFILRFIRTQPARRGIILTLLGFLLSMNIALWGLFDISNKSIMLVFDLIRSSLIAIFYFLPYMIDRLQYPKVRDKGIAPTLIFPVAATAIFFLFSLEGPLDGDTAKDIFAYGPLMFKQLASIFGLWGFVFVFSWFASIINYAWENEFNWLRIRRISLIYSLIIISIFIFGAVKIISLTPQAEKVKIAAIVLLPKDGETVAMDRIQAEKITSPFTETVSEIEKLTKEAAANEAKIISFQEFALTIYQEEESKLREQFKRIAKENDIYLSITYAYFVKEGKGENKHLFINNDGEIVIDYTKRYLLGIGEFGETEVFKKGAEIIQTADTPYGKIGVSICRDMNFSSYIRRGAKKKVDIMLGPSYDWPKSNNPSYSLRAIENGFSFVRPTYNGITYAEDYNGNILAQMDSDVTKDGILYADVPIKGTKTIYSIIGDLLGWLCVLCLLWSTFYSIKKTKQITIMD